MLSQGKEVAGKLLVELQVRKSTADGAGAREFYTALTDPLPGWVPEIRDIVLKKKQASSPFCEFGLFCSSLPFPKASQTFRTGESKPVCHDQR